MWDLGNKQSTFFDTWIMRKRTTGDGRKEDFLRNCYEKWPRNFSEILKLYMNNWMEIAPGSPGSSLTFQGTEKGCCIKLRNTLQFFPSSLSSCMVSWQSPRTRSWGRGRAQTHFQAEVSWQMCSNYHVKFLEFKTQGLQFMVPYGFVKFSCVRFHYILTATLLIDVRL